MRGPASAAASALAVRFGHTLPFLLRRRRPSWLLSRSTLRYHVCLSGRAWPTSSLAGTTLNWQQGHLTRGGRRVTFSSAAIGGTEEHLDGSPYRGIVGSFKKKLKFNGKEALLKEKMKKKEVDCSGPRHGRRRFSV